MATTRNHNDKLVGDIRLERASRRTTILMDDEQRQNLINIDLHFTARIDLDQINQDLP